MKLTKIISVKNFDQTAVVIKTCGDLCSHGSRGVQVHVLNTTQNFYVVDFMPRPQCV